MTHRSVRPDTRMWRRILIVATAALCLASACGTRTTRNEVASLDKIDTRGESPGTAGRGVGEASADPDSAIGPSGGESGVASAPTRRGSPVSGGSGGSSARAPGVTGAGITDKTIKIGIGWFDAAAVGAAVAPGRSYSGSLRDTAEAVVRYINKRGGIAGRQIEPLYHEYPAGDLTTKSGRDRREQAMCADWTEDRRAFVTIPAVASQGVFYECAAQNNLLVVVGANGPVAPVDKEWYRDIGHVWYAPYGMLADRREAMVVDQLHKSGFFGKDAKVGLVFWDSPPVRRAAERVTKPALASRGIKVAATTFYPDPFAHDWPNDVLRFQTAGVTHVVFGSNGCGGVCSAAFMNAAESQGFRPMYGLSTDNAVQAAVDLGPEAQRNNILAMAWTRIWGAEDAGAPPWNENDARCREATKEAGLDTTPASSNSYCDPLFFIKHALEAAGGLNTDAFRLAVEASDFSVAPVASWAVKFGPVRHDGPNAVRTVRYDTPCGCLRYVGGVRHLG